MNTNKVSIPISFFLVFLAGCGPGGGGAPGPGPGAGMPPAEVEVITVTSGSATLTVSPPVRIGEFPPNIIAVDMKPDGSRFLALIAGTGSVTIVHNWRTSLEKKR